MNWWNRKAEKSEQECEFERLNAQYVDMFGRSFEVIFGVGPQQWDEVIAAIRDCIETGRPQRLPVIPDNIYT